MLVYTWIKGQWRPALLVKEGTKFNHYVVIDHSYGVRVVRSKHGYNLNSNVQKRDPKLAYLEAGSRLGITKAAERYLIC